MFRRRKDRTPADQPVYRHEARDRDLAAPAPYDTGRREALDHHLGRHLGDDWVVWHEIVSDLVHLDVAMWRPTEERPAYTFVTQGMSDLPMSIPAELAAQGMTPYAELMVTLPADWPVPSGPSDTAPWQDDNAYFPVRALKMLGRLPHEYDTWLGFGHTIPNGDPPEPLCDGTELVGWLLLPPVSMPQEFSTVATPAGSVELFALVALTADEMDLKLRRGVESLFDGFERHGVSDLLDVRRRSSLR